jgi:hypothetical protein
MVHFNYSHLTRSRKLEEHIIESMDDLVKDRSQVSNIYCFLSRTFDNKDRLQSILKMQIRLKSSDSFVLEKSARSFKTAFKQLKPDLEYMFDSVENRQKLASA